MNELPTPYDILPPTPFPFVLPHSFIYFLLAALVTFIAAWYIMSRKKPESFQSKEHQLKEVLSSFLLKAHPTRSDINQLRIQLQLYLSYFLLEDKPRSMTEQELREISQTHTTATIVTICDLLILMQRERYAQNANIEEIPPMVSRLQKELR